MSIAQDAMLRDQIVGSCRLISRHARGLIEDITAIITMPSYKTEAEETLNHAELVIGLAASAISAAKAEMEKKQLETT
jgi:hypothetical protein